MNKIKSGDEVIIICGKDKGRRGIVKVNGKSDKVIVEGLNRVSKHQKGNPMLGVAGGIVQIDMPIHISNVAIFNPVSKKADKVKIKLESDGKKVRVFKSDGQQVGV